MARRIDASPEPSVPRSDIRRLESSAVSSLIRLVGYWTSEGFQGALAGRAEIDIESRDVPALFLLGRSVSIHPGDLARGLRVSPGNASRMIDRLAQRGYAIRLPDPDDARSSLVTLTPVGAAAAWSLYDAGERLFSELLEEWPAEEIETFSVLVARFADRISSPSPLSVMRVVG